VTQRLSAVVFTIGHSTRTLAEFIALLAAHSVSQLVDARTVRSRHNPQFNGDTLPDALEVAEIGYAHVAGLGGFRHTHPGSPNMHTLTPFARVDGTVITYPPHAASP